VDPELPTPASSTPHFPSDCLRKHFHACHVSCARIVPLTLDSNGKQEKSTYYDVQLLRQPTKNEKRKLVPGTTGGADAASPAPSNDSITQASQASTDRASLSQSMDKSGPQSAAGMRDSSGRQPAPSAEPGVMTSPAVDKRQNNFGQAQQPAALQRASPPSAQSNPGLSQSFDQRTMKTAPTNQHKSLQAPQEANVSPNAHLRTSVDAAINNVDRALSEMHRQEVDRLKARIEVRFQFCCRQSRFDACMPMKFVGLFPRMPDSNARILRKALWGFFDIWRSCRQWIESAQALMRSC
jgi:hypothetical protein